MTTKIKVFGIILICLINFQSYAQNKAISFEVSSFEEMKIKAKKENKLIFLDAFTTWCGPCKWMAKNSFTNDTVADFFNTNFVNAKIDMEKGEGIELSKKYEVRCYPNLLFINGNGEIVHRSGGALNASELIKLAKIAQSDEKNYKYYASNYENKKTDSDFLLNYLSYLSTTCLTGDKILNDYFTTQAETELTSRKNWEIIKKHCNDSKSKEFAYLVKNHNLFYEKYSKDSVDEKISDVILNQARRMIHSKQFQAEKFETFMKETASLSLPNQESIVFNINLELHATKEDWAKFGKLILTDGDRFLKEENLNSVSWLIFEKIADVALVEKAAKWMETFVKNHANDPIYAEYDTYACLLYKLKKKEEALTAVDKAISIAKKMGMPESDYQGTLDLISKIKAL